MCFKKFLILLVVITVIFSGCEPDELVPPNKKEVITTFRYTLTPEDGFPIFLYFQDVDGSGNVPTRVEGGPFKPNSTYTGIITLENEQTTPGVDITSEVKNEALEHQFFFETTVNGLNVTYNDKDANGNPLGLETTFTTGAPGRGTLTVTLLHQPDKTATGVAEGEIKNAGGETDIELTFDISVGETDVITTFTYTLTPIDGFPIFLYHQDIEGAGNVPTQVQGGSLKANSTYAGIIKLENEQLFPSVDITSDIKNEAAGHQFFFETTVNGLNMIYDDMDENGYPLGIETTLTTGPPGSGTLNVTLLHNPDKTADGVADGEIRNAGGETDIELTFDIKVE